LTGKRGQLVEMRKRLLVQIKARLKQGLDEPLEDLDDALRIFLTAQKRNMPPKFADLGGIITKNYFGGSFASIGRITCSIGVPPHII
jgi:hypothetical protein